MRTFKRRAYWRLAALTAAGSTFILSGCDPQLRATVESGIITLSTSLLGSIMRVLIDLAGEASDQTARVLTELGPILA
ncbi:MAG: hypothetical protein KKI02_03890 [Planctomycetes bacterium]|nr:hypothetical protein [Planctomycetota bacterium]